MDKYRPGYPKVAAFEDLDGEFLVYRKFGYLRNYTLLHLQDELSALQGELEGLDEWEATDGDPTMLISRRRDYADEESPRKELIEKIHQKLAQYGESI